MAVQVMATRVPGHAVVVCPRCFWTSGPDAEARIFTAADGHDCPGEPPAGTAKSAITRARRLLAGDY